MPQAAIILLQFLHIFFAAILIGASMYLFFSQSPTLLNRPAGEAKAFMEANLKPTSILMGVSSGMTFLTGLVRGTFFGQIHSFNDLTTPYGITFSVALAVMLVMMVLGPRLGPYLLKNIFKGKQFAPDAQRTVRNVHFIPLFAVVILLGCMVLMHFGL